MKRSQRSLSKRPKKEENQEKINSLKGAKAVCKKEEVTTSINCCKEVEKRVTEEDSA